MQIRKISFLVEGNRVNGTLFLPQKAKKSNPAIMFIHGWRSNESAYAKRAKPLTKLGYICLSYDMRGHGTSDGSINKITLTENLQDAIAGYDFLSSQINVDKNSINVVGSSYGGYLASMLSSKRKLKSLVLRAPALYKNSELDKAKRLVHPSNKQFKNNKALKALSKFKGRIFLIESENDKKIKHSLIVAIIKASRKGALEYVVIADADHTLSKAIWQEEFRNLLTKWFSKNHQRRQKD